MIEWQDLPLADSHRDKLISSAVSPTVAAARGYRTVTDPAELLALGFADYQASLVPAMLIPLHNPRGECVSYQSKPDNPRKDRKRNRVIKYETAAGARLTVDTPLSIVPHMSDASRFLTITEGPIKADSAVSHGWDCVALTGVDCFRGKPYKGAPRSEPLPEWLMIALDGREVGVAFDEDIFTNSGIMDAADRLVDMLADYGANAVILDIRRPVVT